jgi:serine/threonine protein kinase
LQERADSKHPQLQYEYRVYRALSHLEGIPRVRWCGTATNGESEFNVVIMDLLGESLESVFNRCGRKFSLKTTIMLALQLVLAFFDGFSQTFLFQFFL